MMGISDFCAECGEMLVDGSCPLCSCPDHARKIIDGKIDKVSEVGTTYNERHALPIGLRQDAHRRGKQSD